MAYEQKMNSGSFFKNDRFPDKSDMSGGVSIACPHCGAASSWWINAWHRTSAAGVAFINFTLKPKSNDATAKQEESRQPH